MRWWVVGLVAVVGCEEGVGLGPEKICDCAEDEFCDSGGGLCGAGDATPRCKPLPVTCPADDAPVCGCDDVTYDNECEANAAAQTVKYYDGPCEG
jgi:hypothetical protein